MMYRMLIIFTIRSTYYLILSNWPYSVRDDRILRSDSFRGTKCSENNWWNNRPYTVSVYCVPQHNKRWNDERQETTDDGTKAVRRQRERKKTSRFSRTQRDHEPMFDTVRLIAFAEFNKRRRIVRVERRVVTRYSTLSVDIYPIGTLKTGERSWPGMAVGVDPSEGRKRRSGVGGFTRGERWRNNAWWLFK